MAFKFGANILLLVLTILLLFGCVNSVPAASSHSRVLNGFFSNAFAMVMKRVQSLKANTKTALAVRPMMRFESGYIVETVFDGSKLGIEPHSIEVLPNGDLLLLDSANSNLYKISSSLSLYTRPKLITGNSDGYAGHVDGRLREARMNHPKGLAVDDKGNIYIADTDNMAIRKISDSGVSTIAGGKWARGGGHVDGPSEDAKFSNDFDVVYMGSSCSLLVIDRGNRAIREIQLQFDDCAYQYKSGFPLGIAVLIAAGFFGYMLALLQRRVSSIMSSQDGQQAVSVSSNPYQKQAKSSALPPLIPTEDEQEKQQENFLESLTTLIAQAGASAAEILGGIFPIFKKPLAKPYQTQKQYHQQQQKYSSSWPTQDSFDIPEGDEPPSIETKTPTTRKTYAFMSNDSEKMQKLRRSSAIYSGWDVDIQQQHSQKHSGVVPEKKTKGTWASKRSGSWD